jgi:ribonuclease HII
MLPPCPAAWGKRKMKRIILGTDEAGYGPNLGPLVVSLTAWETDSDDLSFLFEPLKKAGITIGDSKKLYHGGSMTALETGVLVPLRSLNKKPAVRSHSRPLPESEEMLDRLAKKFETVLQQHQVRLLDMQSRTVEPKEFNQLLDRFDSKGTLLSHVTLRLIADSIAPLIHRQNAVPILVLCDKHGGRNHYLDLLTEFFPGEFIQTIRQSRESSIYRWTSESRQWEFRFLAKGESHLPVALASMLSKCRREWAMVQFNAFWQSYIPDLQPTAGYPEDAKRFRQQIAAVQKKLGITDESLWRKR